jgi:transcriptional regulator
MLYIPPAFRETDPAILQDEIRRIGFCSLTTIGADGPIVSHVPVMLDTSAGPLGQLRCHVARANPQWRDSDFSKPALAIFMGPDAYVSPSWYPSKAEHGKAVPTWNYAVVHAYGRLEVVQDQAWLLAHVSDLSDQQEAPYAARWATSDAPESYMAVMARGIVGLKLEITRLEAKVKMSQNREDRDRAGVVEGLRERALGEDAEAARLVEKLRR